MLIYYDLSKSSIEFSILKFIVTNLIRKAGFCFFTQQALALLFNFILWFSHKMESSVSF